MHEFIIMVDGELKTYNNFDDIPQIFDHVIKFVPHMPPQPHSESQHKEIAGWNQKLQDLMQREKANARSH